MNTHSATRSCMLLDQCRAEWDRDSVVLVAMNKLSPSAWHVASDGGRLSDAEVFASLDDGDDLPAMMAAAAELRDRGHGATVSYSRKVFIPLTQLCRDCCHYCTFAHPPRRGSRAYLSSDEVFAIARAGARRRMP